MTCTCVDAATRQHGLTVRGKDGLSISHQNASGRGREGGQIRAARKPAWCTEGERQGINHSQSLPPLSPCMWKFPETSRLDGKGGGGLQLDVDGDVIRISSDYKKETEDESPEGTEPSMRWHRVERVQEYSTRALRMPETADLSKLEASMEGGVLTVKVPKHEAAHSKARRIDIK